MSPYPDVAVIGGGIVGCAAAALLAESSASVELFERGTLAQAASGRNSGSIQHPFDPVLTELHVETLDLYRHYLRDWSGHLVPTWPAGVLTLTPADGDGPNAVRELAAEIARALPELRPTVFEGPDLQALEPLLAADLIGCRLETGYPVRPSAATLGFADVAREAGARIHEHAPARPWIEDGKVRGVMVGEAEKRPADVVVVAAGPWTPALVDPNGEWRPIAPLWGVVAEIDLGAGPAHVLEEAGVEGVGVGARSDVVFSVVAADGVSGLGSTFELDEPDPGTWVDRLRERGRRFVPAVADAPVLRTRVCARPQSRDGRPLVGPVPAAEGLWVACGNGAWGISTGPGTAALLLDALIGGREIPAALLASRFD